jgi:hypothetical protein
VWGNDMPFVGDSTLPNFEDWSDFDPYQNAQVPGSNDMLFEQFDMRWPQFNIPADNSNTQLSANAMPFQPHETQFDTPQWPQSEAPVDDPIARASGSDAVPFQWPQSDMPVAGSGAMTFWPQSGALVDNANAWASGSGAAPLWPQSDMPVAGPLTQQPLRPGETIRGAPAARVIHVSILK